MKTISPGLGPARHNRRGDHRRLHPAGGRANTLAKGTNAVLQVSARRVQRRSDRGRARDNWPTTSWCGGWPSTTSTATASASATTVRRPDQAHRSQDRGQLHRHRRLRHRGPANGFNGVNLRDRREGQHRRGHLARGAQPHLRQRRRRRQYLAGSSTARVRATSSAPRRAGPAPGQRRRWRGDLTSHRQHHRRHGPRRRQHHSL